MARAAGEHAYVRVRSAKPRPLIRMSAHNKIRYEYRYLSVDDNGDRPGTRTVRFLPLRLER